MHGDVDASLARDLERPLVARVGMPHHPGAWVGREDALEVDVQPDRARGEPETPGAVDDDERPPVAR